MSISIKENPTTFVDLCCGIGSFTRSFERHGFESVLACDVCPVVRRNYQALYPGHRVEGDIHKIDFETVPRHDIVCCGFPCQPFSQQGKGKGLQDSRASVIDRLYEWIERFKPKVVVFENVPGLARHDGGKTLKGILDRLESAGYSSVYKILKASEFGLPQIRRRVFIILWRKNVETRNIDEFFNMTEFEKECSMSEYLGRGFVRKHAYTVRCTGRGYKIGDRHNWDSYLLSDGSIHRLTINDALALQGFRNVTLLKESKSKSWSMVGNTIPCVFTHMIAIKIKRHFVL